MQKPAASTINQADRKLDRFEIPASSALSLVTNARCLIFERERANDQPSVFCPCTTGLSLALQLAANQSRHNVDSYCEV